MRHDELAGNAKAKPKAFRFGGATVPTAPTERGEKRRPLLLRNGGPVVVHIHVDDPVFLAGFDGDGLLSIAIVDRVTD